MGIFSPNYSKEGPGVDKNAPKKKGLFLYFDILGRKFVRLCQANLLYMAASLPLIVLLYFFFGIFVSFPFAEWLTDGVTMEAQNIDGSTIHSMMRLWITLAGTSIYLCLWGSGPASAGFAYISRCFSREQNAFIWMDFKEQFKANFKKSILVAVIDVVMLFLAVNAVHFYFSMYLSTGQFMWVLLVYIAMLALMIYSFAHMHIYQIMVTFECSFAGMWKNALILALAKLPVNLALTAVALAFNLLIYSLLPNPLLAFIINFIAGFMFVRFPMEFYSAKVIDGNIKNMPKKAKITYIEEDE